MHLSIRSQQGAFSMLTVIIIGLLMSGLAFTLYSNTSATQSRGMTTHAITHSEGGAWFAANTINQYIEDHEVLTDADGVISIGVLSKANDTLEIKVDDNSIASFNMTKDLDVSDIENIKVYGNISYQDASAKASSNMDVVFLREANPELEEIDPPLLWFGDYIFKQGNTVFSEDGVIQKLFINGDFLSNDASDSFSGVDVLKATGKVKLGSSNQHWKEIHSNVEVDLTQTGLGGTYEKVTSGGDLKIGEQTIVLTAHADGNITHDGRTGTTNSLSAQGNISISSKATANIIDMHANGAVATGELSLGTTDINAKTVRLTGKQPNLVTVNASQSITCNDQPSLYGVGGSEGLTLTAAEFTGCRDRAATYLDSNNVLQTTNGIINARLDSSLEVSSVPNVTELPITKKPIINATSYKSEANFLFDTISKGTHQLIVLKMQNVAEVETDGSITIHEGPVDSEADALKKRGGYDYWVTPNGLVCPRNIHNCGAYRKDSDNIWSVMNPNWDSRDNSLLQICTTQNGKTAPCIKATKSGGVVTFNLKGDGNDYNGQFDNAPGIYYFNGNLTLKSANPYSKGFFGNTFVATHNINANAGVNMASVNFAGPEIVCKHAQSSNLEKKPHVEGGFESDTSKQSETKFNHIFPSNICGEANNNFDDKIKLSNISLLAGHSPTGDYDENQVYVDYVGGQIEINNSKIMGTILAGNNFKNGANDSIVWGNLQTLNNDCETNYPDSAGEACPNNNLIQKTKIQFKELPENYSASVVPEIVCDDEMTANCQSERIISVKSSVLWAKFK